jgi:hypothetical protein
MTERRVVVVVLVVGAQVVEAPIPLVEIVRHVVVAVTVGQRLVIVLLETVVIRHRHLQVSSRNGLSSTQAIGRPTQQRSPASARTYPGKVPGR